MKIVIPGGTGQIGTLLARALSAKGHQIVLLSRTLSPSPWRVVLWDGKTEGGWFSEIDGAQMVLNLAGRSVNCRCTPENRRTILESRVNSTAIVGQAISEAKRPPVVWLQASTATIYAHRFDAPNDEKTGILGGNEPGLPDTWKYSINVAQAWEAALESAPVPKTRKIALRSAMTMSPDRGGVFDVLLGLVRRGLGGKSGDGKQYISWIHEADFVRSVEWLAAREEIAGAVNLCAPNPVPNAEFMEVLRRAWGIPFGLPANRMMLEAGAFFLQTETELILKSRRVVPGRLLESGFRFQYPDWNSAAEELCTRRRQNRGRRN